LDFFCDFIIEKSENLCYNIIYTIKHIINYVLGGLL